MGVSTTYNLPVIFRNMHIIDFCFTHQGRQYVILCYMKIQYETLFSFVWFYEAVYDVI